MFNLLDFFFSVICSIVGFLLLVGTLYDMFIYQRPENSDIVSGRFNKPEIEPPILNSDTAHLLSTSSQGTLIHRVLHNRMYMYLQNFFITRLLIHPVLIQYNSCMSVENFVSLIFV